MSSAIQTIGGTQIVRLGSPLILGIRLQGTLGHLNPTNATHIRARPYLRYLADTLKHLRCDVTLLVSTNHQNDSHVISQFSSLEFPIPFRLLHDHDDVHQRTNRHRNVSTRNYTPFFRAVAAEHGATTERVLFIDSEINYRFTPVQTLVLEAYEPMSRRQQRQELRKRMKDGKEKEWQRQDSATPSSPLADPSATLPHRVEGTPRGARATEADKALHPEERAGLHREQQRRREEHQKKVHAAMQATDKHTQTLRAEQHFASALAEPQTLIIEDTFEDLRGGRAGDAGGSSGSSNWLGRHDGYRHRVTTRNTASHESDKGAGSEHEREGNEKNEEHFTAEDYHAAAAEASHALAINMEDFSLVALADMITQLAASDMPVRDFLRTEPLVEKLRVPFHGVANYLPIENCDFIDVLDWDKIKVQEQEARDPGVPDIKENEEHRDFFK